MNKKVILCVDDEKMILFVLKQQLKSYFKEQYIYETAENAKEAMDLIDDLKAKNVPIGLIISDWLMPGMKGDEFLIKTHQKYPEIPSIMVTGQAEHEAIENAKKDAGLKACFFKPWEMEEVFPFIEKVVENS